MSLEDGDGKWMKDDGMTIASTTGARKASKWDVVGFLWDVMEEEEGEVNEWVSVGVYSTVRTRLDRTDWT